ncbi:inositol monophosphatase [Streptacidiphilus sp. N1-12]|uniref:Inositol monophosphatase n=2 Tax=Streptacidiphilus alkalitolerans TaxID=3342712 RepID=A0ABV6VD21_9ACTN
MSDTLTLMARAAQDAAALLPRRTGPHGFDSWPAFKAAFDAVDRPTTALLRERLEIALPGTAWAEEIDTDLPPGGEQWVVDAVDGAVQYLQGLPQWSVSIALVREGRPVLAALHSAVLGHTYTAALGGGAFLDGAPITPSGKTDLSLALVATSQPPFVGRQPGAVADAGRALSLLLPAVGAVRNLGPTSWQLADVGSGRIDAFYEYGRDAGNLLAGSLVASEAGALVTDINGRPWHPASPGFLAAPPALHGRILSLLATARTTPAG